MARTDRRDLPVLRRKRDATRYRILVEVAARQPAVSQREIAEAIDVTAQAVSEYVGDLVEDGFVEKHGRGRYEITKEGVDWLITRTDELRSFAEFVGDEVIERVEIEAAIATAPIAEGERVSLSMRDGTLCAHPGGTGRSTAVAASDADEGEAVGVTDFEGLLEYDPGTVTVLTVPSVSEGRIDVDQAVVGAQVDRRDLLAVAGTEALAVARLAGRDPDIRFGTADAIPEAAMRGLDVLLLAVEPSVPTHTDRLRDANVSYEVVDLTEPNGLSR